MRPVIDGCRRWVTTLPGASLPPISYSWVAPAAVLFVAFSLYIVSGQIDPGSSLGASAIAVVVAVAGIAVAVFRWAGHDARRLSVAWGSAYFLCALGIGAAASADTGEAGAVSPISWMHLLVLAIAAQGFGARYVLTLTVFSSVLVFVAEALGDMAGYPTGYQVAGIASLVLIAAGLSVAALARGHDRHAQPSGDLGRMSAARLEVAARDSTAAIGVFNERGTLRFASPALKAMLPADFPADPELALGEDAAQALREAIAGRPRRYEFLLRDAEGGVRSIDGVFFPLDSGAGLMAIDVTDLRDLKTYLPRVQRMETLGFVAGGLAHDFNNLLTVVLGNLHVVREAVGQSPDAQHVIEETTRACQRAAELIRQLLDYARPREVALKHVPVRSLLDETASLAKGMLPAAVEFKVGVPAPSSVVEVDRLAIQQVLLNLVVNARDALPHGGKIMIDSAEARVETASPLAQQGLPAGRYQVISVADTGIGMDAVTLQRAFDPFFTTKGDRHGSGLGLTTARNIVQSFGGVITAESAPSLGTTFKVYLPSTEDPHAPAES